jgi:hypothetical protein
MQTFVCPKTIPVDTDKNGSACKLLNLCEAKEIHGSRLLTSSPASAARNRVGAPEAMCTSDDLPMDTTALGKGSERLFIVGPGGW